jgi:hypothetical protein
MSEAAQILTERKTHSSINESWTDSARLAVSGFRLAA